ncbi:MAG: hypothetical protein ACLTEH_03790 [Clostridia bacterium]
MKRMKKCSVIIGFIIVFLIQSLYLPIMSLAKEDNAISLDVTLYRDSKDPNKIQIKAIDTQYKITILKYVHRAVSLNEISYFEEEHSDIYTFPITPSMQIEESFILNGYGTYTVYAKNEYGNRFLSRITIKDPMQVPQLSVSQEEEEPFSIHIKATSQSGKKLNTLKIAKKNDYQEIIDFKSQGMDIPFTSAMQIDMVYTQIVQTGIYALYVADEEGNSATTTLYVSEQKTPITLNVSSMEANRNIQIQVSDAISNITTIKIAKKEEITDFDDFQTKGITLPITPAKEVNTNYTIPEDGTYVIYVKDEVGYQKMLQKRFASEEKVMNIVVKQDATNPSQLAITANNTITNIIEMKVAIGDDITIDYFEQKGEPLSIIPGKTVVANYQLQENAILNVYVKDEDGYSYMLSKAITGIDESLPPQAPSISLAQNIENPKQIDVFVRGLDAYIRKVKWAIGKQNVSYFETNGTQIGTESVGKIVQTHFSISSIGIYTVYAIDNNGKETVEYIQIHSIEEPVVPDNIKPTITGVEDNGIYTNNVTPISQDEHLKQVKLTKDGQIIANYTNGIVLSEEGVYQLTAIDESANETTVCFTIDKTPPQIITKIEPPENKQVNVEIQIEEKTTSLKMIKVAEGKQEEGYFKENGEQIEITAGQKTIVANWPITQNGIYTIYTQDMPGNVAVYSFEITTLIEDSKPTPSEDKTPPTIVVHKQLVDNNQKVEVTLKITDTQSSIAKAKVAVGKQELAYFEKSGEILELAKDINTATVTFGILQNGWYTIYAEDEAANSTIKQIEITQIEKEEEQKPTPDITPPTILGVKDNHLYEQTVTPVIQDENLLQVSLTKDGKVVEDYKNGDTITGKGKYVLTAIDKAGNKTVVTFTIISSEKPNIHTNATGNNNQTNGNTTTENNQNSLVDNTASGRLPQTGESLYLGLAICFVSVIAVYAYCKYKKMK